MEMMQAVYVSIRLFNKNKCREMPLKKEEY
jgi:hypothetical protein